MIIIDSTYKFMTDGITGTASANTTTNFDYQMPASWAIYGFALIQSGALFGDYIAIQIVDKDNILGFGAGVVIAAPVTKGYIDPATTRIEIKSDYARTVLSGLYIRIKYTSTSLITPVLIATNFMFINPS